MSLKLQINSVLGDLELINTSIDISDYIFSVYNIFEKNKASPGVILLKEGEFYGLLSKIRFFEVMSKQFMYDLYSKRKVEVFFDEENSKRYLILDSSTTILSATNLALNRNESDIFEPVIVKCIKNEYRLLDFYQLLVAQNEIQLLMNDLLKQANEFKKEVLAITTHDLKNPIGTILGFSDLMINLNDVDALKEYATYIHKSATQMEDLVNDFLVSTCNDSLEYNIVFSDFEVSELISSVIKSFESAVEKKKQKIIFEKPDEPIEITSDHIKIREVIENLISNAVKYSKPEMEIKVELQKKENSVEISVEDQGPGFLDSDMKKIFGKFQRLSARPTGNESSTGLGLFITKTIVDKLNGSIDLKSEPGKGSIFRVRLPLLREISLNPEIQSVSLTS